MISSTLEGGIVLVIADAKDEGEILFLGKPVNFKTSKEALENGISMVHQELNLVRQTSVITVYLMSSVECRP